MYWTYNGRVTQQQQQCAGQHAQQACDVAACDTYIHASVATSLQQACPLAWCCTCAAGYGWPYYFDRFGTYKRVNGTTPTIVHQYDRRGAAAQIMKGVYPVFPQGYHYDGPNATTNSILPHCAGATAVTAGQAA